jgi:hypothetical protein
MVRPSMPSRPRIERPAATISSSEVRAGVGTAVLLRISY